MVTTARGAGHVSARVESAYKAKVERLRAPDVRLHVSFGFLKNII